MTYRIRAGAKVLGGAVVVLAVAFVLWVRVIIDVRLIESHDRVERSNERLRESLDDVKDACLTKNGRSL